MLCIPVGNISSDVVLLDEEEPVVTAYLIFSIVMFVKIS